MPRHLKRRLVRNPRVADLGHSARSFFRQRATLDRKRIVMESICTAETAEDAEIAPLRPSAISAVSAVPPAFGPRILRKKMPGIFMGRSRVSSLSRSMTPNRRTNHCSERADRACDSGRRVSAPPGVSCEESACALVRAWLTLDVRQNKHVFFT